MRKITTFLVMFALIVNLFIPPVLASGTIKLQGEIEPTETQRLIESIDWKLSCILSILGSNMHYPGGLITDPPADIDRLIAKTDEMISRLTEQHYDDRIVGAANLLESNLLRQDYIGYSNVKVYTDIIRNSIENPYPRVYDVSPQSGPVGTTVNIAGSGFCNATQVMFGDVLAKIMTVNNYLITTIAPENIGEVDITVTTNWGTSGIFKPYAVFTYIYAEPEVKINVDELLTKGENSSIKKEEPVETTQTSEPVIPITYSTYSTYSSGSTSALIKEHIKTPIKEEITEQEEFLQNEIILKNVTPVLKNCLLENDHTLMKIRGLEQLGATVAWDATTREIIINYKDKQIILFPDSTEFTVNGYPSTLPVPVKIIEGRSYAPLRVIAENLKLTINYNDSTRQITIH